MSATAAPVVTEGPEPGGAAASEYAAYMQQLAVEQDARKTSIEQRGLAVITTSGTLVTLLFALVALLTKATDFELPKQGRGPLAVALIAFVTAACLALLTNLPLFYKGADLSDPNKAVWKHWDKSKTDALQRITATRMTIVKRAQKVNGFKAWLLIVAMAAEVFAVGALAVAMAEVLKHG